ncbi:MAG: hypothetical protein C0443_07470 [Comamonadaceae bacterium]|nr:hypothetical protein [Comamonadaceae bacterium]
MKALIWGLTALFAAGWTGLVWVTHQLTGWLLGAVDAGTLKEAGGTVAGLPVPPLPDWLAPWVDTAWLEAVLAWSAGLLGWLGAVLPSGGALMAWVGPLLWIGWGLGLLTLLILAGLLHVLVARVPSVRQAVQAGRA